MNGKELIDEINALVRQRLGEKWPKIDGVRYVISISPEARGSQFARYGSLLLAQMQIEIDGKTFDWNVYIQGKQFRINNNYYADIDALMAGIPKIIASKRKAVSKIPTPPEEIIKQRDELIKKMLDKGTIEKFDDKGIVHFNLPTGTRRINDYLVKDTNVVISEVAEDVPLIQIGRRLRHDAGLIVIGCLREQRNPHRRSVNEPLDTQFCDSKSTTSIWLMSSQCLIVLTILSFCENSCSQRYLISY